ncbi:hypothetical protein CARUB_v10028582mg [Capsella rubella]|uniref:C2H2-type domain-containing protein n=1 Tax=Capsella rubella TaxID=81985 RepID=R0GEM8_9BRAS|nr:hypothetical protein CARUB_v10028582mg [Capsella rubella]
MSSNPNMFNIDGDHFINHGELFPLQMNQNSRMFRSMFTTDDHMNYENFFASTPYFSSYQNSQISSSSFPFSIGSVSRARYFPNNIFDSVQHEIDRVNLLNPPPISLVYPDQDPAAPRQFSAHYSVAPRHTGPPQYSAAPHYYASLDHPVVPQHFAIPPHLTSPHHFATPRHSIAPNNSATPHLFVSPHHIAAPHRSNMFSFSANDNHILNPSPIRVVYPDQDPTAPHHFRDPHYSTATPHSADPHHFTTPHQFTAPHHFGAPDHFAALDHLDIFSSSSSGNHLSQEEDEESDDDEYDGRTHSIPCKKKGPYTCPKCNCVFDTSQKFSAHMLFHYKSETSKEKDRRLRARNKKKYRKFMASLRRTN